MPEVVHPRDGDEVALRPCPPWCTQERHFGNGEVIHASDGFHHYGTEAEVPVSCTLTGAVDDPQLIVRVVVKSWTHPMDADPSPAQVELNLGTAEVRTDACGEMTPGEARAVAQALLDAASQAER